MKKLVGGDYLLDLTPIELEESEDGETYTNITNKEIIEQLTNLKKFVPNPSMVKPVWVKLKNGETDEIVVVRGEFKVVDANEFEIVVAIDGYKLKIHIEFTQATLSDDTPIDDWYIDTNDAKYLFTSDAQNVKATIEDADFGDVELAGDLSVGGDASVTGDLTAKTISQSQANWKSNQFDFGAPTGLTITNVYNRLERVNGILYVVVNIKLQNNGDANATFSGVDVGVPIIDNIVADNVVDILGNKVSESPSSDYIFICGDSALIQKNSNTYEYLSNSGKIFICNRQTANFMSVFISPDTTITLEPTEFLNVSGRIVLTLI